MMDENRVNPGTPKMEIEKKSGAGVFLKEERERRGYSIDQVAGIVKIRKRYIEAMEREDWEKLPSPIFVKGFLRSYAKALKVDDDKVIDLFKSNSHLKEIMPVPLMEPEKSNKKFILAVIIILLFLLLSLYFLLTRYPGIVGSQQAKGILNKADKVTIDYDNSYKVNKHEIIDAGVQEVKDTDNTGADETKSKEPLVPLQEAEGGSVEKEAVENQEIPNAIGPEDTVSIASTGVTVEKDNPAMEPNEENRMLSLVGIVKMRTYVKIYIDGLPPKEYIFTPGSRPQWEARQGFDILVGNAAGIEFDFNGKLKKDLGAFGRVVRISFPEDFKADARSLSNFNEEG